MNWYSKKELIEWITTLYNEENCTYEFYEAFLKNINK